MQTFYTYTPYTGEEIIDYINNHPTSLFAEECVRKYYIEDPFCLYFESTLVKDKLYYIRDYKRYWDFYIGREYITTYSIDSYKILRATRLPHNLEKHQPQEIK